MNIALFSDCYYPTKNGVVTVVMQAKSILRKMGHHVVIVTVDTSRLEAGPDADAENSDPLVFRTPSVPLGLGTDHFVGFPHEAQILKFLKGHNIEIIHSHTEFVIAHAARLMAKKLHVPAIVTTHTMWEDYIPFYIPMGKLIPHKAVLKATRRIYKKFYAMINVSQKVQDYFKQPLILPNTPSAIIPNAVDTEAFLGKKDTPQELSALRQSWGIGEGDIVLLYVGRIAEEKRVFELLDIFASVIRRSKKSVKAMFAGRGPAFKSMMEIVQRMKLTQEIIFTGYISWEELHSYYAMADIFAAASLSESFAMTVLEAMISSLPVVVRDDDCVRDKVIDGENGFLAATDAEMKERLLELIDDSEKREAFGKRSEEISRKFSLEAHGRKTEAFYKEALKAFPGKLDEKKLRDAVERA